VSSGEGVRTHSGRSLPDETAAAPPPMLVADPCAASRTGLILFPRTDTLPASAPFSHQTGRYMPLSLRCATALFAHFGIEWDISEASQEELAELVQWIQLYKRYRHIIHSGRVVRLETPDDTAWMHGFVSTDASAALMSYVQLDEPGNGQPVAMRVPGLDPQRRYRVTDLTPGRVGIANEPIGSVEASGAALAEIGLAISALRTLTAAVLLIEAI